VHQTSDPPFSKFTRQAGKLLESVSHGYCGFAHTDQTWAPCVNLYETEDAYRVCVDLAGVDKDRIELAVHGPLLLIRGERPMPRSPHASSRSTASRARVHRMEIDHGSFAREVELPADVEPKAISATYRNGLLWVELPKVR
jgi:HSP20 family protein